MVMVSYLKASLRGVLFPRGNPYLPIKPRVILGQPTRHSRTSHLLLRFPDDGEVDAPGGCLSPLEHVHHRKTHPLGGSDAVAAGEGFIRRLVSYPMKNRLPPPGLRARLSQRESIDRNCPDFADNPGER